MSEWTLRLSFCARVAGCLLPEILNALAVTPAGGGLPFWCDPLALPLVVAGCWRGGVSANSMPPSVLLALYG